MASQSRQKAKAIRVLVADDHDDVRKTVCLLLGSENGIAVVGTASNGQQAIDEAIKLKPDIIIMDWKMPVMDGLAAAQKIKKERPQTAIVMFSMHANKSLTEQVKSLGLDGFVPKEEDGPALIRAIDAVVHGRTYFTV